MDVVLPIRTLSESNARSHWSARARRTKMARACVALALTGRLRGLLARSGVGAVLVILTRYAPSSGLDGDNLQSSLKATRDGVADALGVDDGDVRIAWQYEQADGRKVPKDSALRASLVRGYGVRIQVLRRG